MGRPLNPLGELGEQVAGALKDDGGARGRAIAQARRQLLDRSLSQPDQQRPKARWPYALVAVAAALALGFGLTLRPAPLAFQVDGHSGAAETWLAAPLSKPLQLSFSDGTRFDVAPASRARVVETSADGASLALESGALTAQVVHTSHSAWSLIAGPFAVRVTGTRFDLSWDPAAQSFALFVREGSVVVSGSIVGSERPVRAGQRLAASVAAGTLELRDVAAATAAPTSAAPEPLAEAVPEARTASPVATASGRESSTVAWRELAKSGDLRQAFAAAEMHGFQAACDSATAAELLLLGDAARVSGRADRAIEALTALRRRYPKDPRRAAAAFALGKVAFDQRRAYAQAATWFATCMSEQPSGPLAREAAGRRLEALKRAGDVAGARAAAERYLASYPDGPHAGIAREQLK